MPCITVHYGPPGSERNQKLFEASLSLYDPCQTTFLYLVLTAAREWHLGKAFLDRFSQTFEIPVLTFPGLVRAALKGKEIEHQVISEGEKRRFIGEILQGSNLVMARDPQRRAGLLPFISQHISTLKRQNLRDEEMLRLRYQKFAKQLAPLEEELVEVFSRYQHLLEERCCEDKEGLYCLLYESLLTGALKPDSAFPGLQRLVVEGFSSLSPIERGILQVFTSEIDETHFSIDLDSPQRELDRFSEACQELVGFFDDLQVNWFFHERRHDPAPASLLRPESREDEVREVARRIVRLKMEQGDLDLTEIALICSDPGDYKAYVREIFGEFGIAFHWLPGRSLAESQAVSAFLNYLRLLQQDFRREELFDFLSSPWVQIPDLSSAEIQLMDRLSIRAGIVGGFQQWTSAFPLWIAQYVEELRDGIDCQESRKKKADWIERTSSLFLTSLQSLSLEPGPSPGRSSLQWSRLLTERLQPFFRTHPAPTERAVPWSRSENLSLSRFFEELRRRAALSEADSLDLPAFGELIARELSQVSVREEWEEEAVMVGDKRDFQQCRFRFLFWIGFAEGKIPNYPPQNIFFDDTRSQQWGFRNWKANLAESYSLFHVLRCAATERVYFSCSRRVAEMPILASPLARYLKSEPEPQAGQSAAEPPPLAVKGRTENVKRGIRAQTQREGPELSVFDGVFASPEVRSLLRQEFFSEGMELSPTRLEEYVQCGFRYFTRRVLRVEPPHQIEQEWTPLERGGLIHRVLFRFMGEGFTRSSQLGVKSRQEWVQTQRRRMAAIVREELSHVRFQDLFWKHQEARLVGGLEDGSQGLLAHFIELEGVRSERSAVYALESRLGPIRLSDQPLLFHGTVDRIDREGDQYFLLDYKTGRQDYRKRVFEGWGFQLPLYILAAAQTLSGDVQGAAFYHLRLPLEVEIKEIALREASSFERLINYYRDKALKAASQLYEGQFPVTLLRVTDAGCRTCEFRDICRVDPARMQQVKLSGRFLADETVVKNGHWVGPEDRRSSES